MPTGADEVRRNLRAWADRRRGAIIALAQNWAGTLEGRAKEQAGWTDRTGAARAGLRGSVELRGLRRDTVVIKLGHSVEYGVFLELANDGKYAVLKPTIDKTIPEIYESYRRLWEGPG